MGEGKNGWSWFFTIISLFIRRSSKCSANINTGPRGKDVTISPQYRIELEVQHGEVKCDSTQSGVCTATQYFYGSSHVNTCSNQWAWVQSPFSKHSSNLYWNCPQHHHFSMCGATMVHGWWLLHPASCTWGRWKQEVFTRILKMWCGLRLVQDTGLQRAIVTNPPASVLAAFPSFKV